jgi:hypothetical protein
MRLVCGIASAALLSGFANAFPTSTGSCDAGTGAILKPGFSHATNAQVGTGPLSDSGINVTLNGDLLVPDTPIDISTMMEYNLTIVTSETPFTGFLARIEGSGDDPYLDTTSALAPYDTQSQVAVSTCINVNRVGGVSHTNKDLKTSVSNKLQMVDPAAGLLLDITVVIRNVDSQNVSEWYYSRYVFNAVSPPTDAPTMMFPSEPTPDGAGGAEPTEPTMTPTSSAVSMLSILAVTSASIGAFILST